jgi:hypothetical protein
MTTKSYYSNIILGDAPWAYWRLGEASGNLNDATGNGRSITVSSATGLTYSVAGPLVHDPDTAMSSDGTNSTQAYTATALYAPWTFECWAKPNTTANNAVAGSRFSSNGWDMQLDVSGGKVHCDLGDGGSTWYNTAADATVTWGSGWHHIVLVVSSGTYWIYFDGVQAATGSTTGGALTDSSHQVGLFGSGSGNPRYNGSVDECAIWLSNLTAAQIYQHYEAGKASFARGVPDRDRRYTAAMRSAVY